MLVFLRLRVYQRPLGLYLRLWSCMCVLLLWRVSSGIPARCGRGVTSLRGNGGFGGGPVAGVTFLSLLCVLGWVGVKVSGGGGVTKNKKKRRGGHGQTNWLRIGKSPKNVRVM